MRLYLLVAVFLLVLSMVVVNAAEKPPSKLVLPKISKPHAKIDPHLLEEMKKKSEVPVIIMLKDQPPPSKPFRFLKQSSLHQRLRQV